MSFIRKSRGSPAPRAELASLMVFGDWSSNPVVTCPRGLRPPWALHGTWEDRGLGSLEGSVLSSRHCPRGRSESPCPPAPGLPLPHPCHKGFTQGPAWPYSKGGSRRRRPGRARSGTVREYCSRAPGLCRPKLTLKGSVRRSQKKREATWRQGPSPRLERRAWALSQPRLTHGVAVVSHGPSVLLCEVGTVLTARLVLMPKG